jgi:agmatine deiminase
MNAETFSMPAQWQPHAATWLSWPHNTDTWSQNLELAQAEFRAFVEAIARFEPVNLMAEESAAARLKFDSRNVRLVPIPTNDAWARDYAPTFVKSSSDRLKSIDWFYNAWGGKYPPFDLDQKVASAVAEFLKIENTKVDFCLEGGALEINRKGTLITTRSCALAENRNPDSSQAKAESLFRRHLGAENIIWLPGDAIQGDDTDGHIDQLARFTDDSTIVHAWTVDSDDPRRPAIKQNVDALKAAMTKVDSSCRFFELPIPDPIYYCDLTLPASYCNFLIVNGGVIVPQFDQAESDANAVQILSTCFPDREIVPLPSKNLTVGLGSFHCLSQQQPKT